MKITREFNKLKISLHFSLGSHHDHVGHKDEEFPDALDHALFSQHVPVRRSLREISKLEGKATFLV